MTANKRITDLTNYTSVLPYASELFGIYQPLIGWRSKRRERRFRAGITTDMITKVLDLRSLYRGIALVPFNADAQMEEGGAVEIGRPGPPPPRNSSSSRLLAA